MDAEIPPSEPPISDNIISINLDLRAIIRIALVWAAEYAMLSLIEDASELVKIATLICAVSALAIMQFELWLRKFQPNAFRNSLIVVVVIYSGFIGFAVKHGADAIAIRFGLESRYVEGVRLTHRTIPIDIAKNAFEPGALDSLVADANKWESETAHWLFDNLGPAAEARFLDTGNYQTMY